ncbi:SHOCT domain-containing protein [Clostridium beijerinckii]|uniref:SHOCT domain-containing protein n=1 Tax=Clostridium beijerinckii TaxID=1520 RepID=UPI001F4BFFDB|nr:SHOCT domain-containing protein [Clostridium beijerinckii]NRT77884.1 putative membrane protein [Clostridium beijerinckii]
MGIWNGMMIIPIFLIIAFIYMLFNKRESNNYKGARVKGNAIDILNERFSRGEINEDEYISKKNILK